MITLPNFKFVGDASSENIDDYFRFIKNNPLDFADEVEKPDEVKKKISKMINCAYQFGLDNGIDLTSRLPSVKNFHFLEEKEFGAFKKKRKQNERAEGFTDNYFGEIIIGHDNSVLEPENHLLITYNHELIHVLSYKEIYINGKTKDYWLKKEGICTTIDDRDEILRFFNEGITELSSREIIKNYWPNQKELSASAEQYLKNQNYVLALCTDHIIKAVSELLKESYKKVYKDLQKDMFLGDNISQKVLVNTLGNEKYKLIARWKSLNLRGFYEFSKSLGIGSLTEQIYAFSQGKGLFFNFKYEV